eukprot:TRINITY_DN1206_c1_g1_i4.p1 TRINITY_DN1206_c1_g1~~TRINITY_DN1206_c1_g1_i4.p1  ORF type:complete len:981 (-),score=215.10 TRINITY_DN1206_c1_g1_i4:96-3038(-)
MSLRRRGPVGIPAIVGSSDSWDMSETLQSFPSGLLQPVSPGRTPPPARANSVGTILTSKEIREPWGVEILSTKETAHPLDPQDFGTLKSVHSLPSGLGIRSPRDKSSLTVGRIVGGASDSFDMSQTLDRPLLVNKSVERIILSLGTKQGGSPPSVRNNTIDSCSPINGNPGYYLPMNDSPSNGSSPSASPLMLSRSSGPLVDALPANSHNFNSSLSSISSVPSSDSVLPSSLSPRTLLTSSVSSRGNCPMSLNSSSSRFDSFGPHLPNSNLERRDSDVLWEERKKFEKERARTRLDPSSSSNTPGSTPLKRSHSERECALPVDKNEGEEMFTRSDMEMQRKRIEELFQNTIATLNKRHEEEKAELEFTYLEKWRKWNEEETERRKDELLLLMQTELETEEAQERLLALRKVVSRLEAQEEKYLTEIALRKKELRKIKMDYEEVVSNYKTMEMRSQLKKAEIAASQKHIEIVQSGLKYGTLNIQLPDIQHTLISAAVLAGRRQVVQQVQTLPSLLVMSEPEDMKSFSVPEMDTLKEFLKNSSLEPQKNNVPREREAPRERERLTRRISSKSLKYDLERNRKKKIGEPAEHVPDLAASDGVDKSLSPSHTHTPTVAEVRILLDSVNYHFLEWQKQQDLAIEDIENHLKLFRPTMAALKEKGRGSTASQNKREDVRNERGTDKETTEDEESAITAAGLYQQILDFQNEYAGSATLTNFTLLQLQSIFGEFLDILGLRFSVGSLRSINLGSLAKQDLSVVKLPELLSVIEDRDREGFPLPHLLDPLATVSVTLKEARKNIQSEIALIDKAEEILVPRIFRIAEQKLKKMRANLQLSEANYYLLVTKINDAIIPIPPNIPKSKVAWIQKIVGPNREKEVVTVTSTPWKIKEMKDIISRANGMKMKCNISSIDKIDNTSLRVKYERARDIVGLSQKLISVYSELPYMKQAPSTLCVFFLFPFFLLLFFFRALPNMEQVTPTLHECL